MIVRILSGNVLSKGFQKSEKGQRKDKTVPCIGREGKKFN
jgi:hypothetical protein